MPENTGYKETCNNCLAIWPWIDTCCPECGSTNTEEYHTIECDCKDCKNGSRKFSDYKK